MPPQPPIFKEIILRILILTPKIATFVPKYAVNTDFLTNFSYFKQSPLDKPHILWYLHSMTHDNLSDEELRKYEEGANGGKTLPNPPHSPTDNGRMNRLEAIVERLAEKADALEAGILTTLNEIKEQATPKAPPAAGHAASLSSLKELTSIAKTLSEIGEKGRQVAHDQGIEVGEMRESIRTTYEENDGLRANLEKLQISVEETDTNKAGDVNKLIETLGPAISGIIDTIAPARKS